VSQKFSKSKMIGSKKFSTKFLMEFFHTNNIVFIFIYYGRYSE